jgi:hypothetical protein
VVEQTVHRDLVGGEPDRMVSLDELAQLLGRFEVRVAACPQYADTDGY